MAWEGAGEAVSRPVARRERPRQRTGVKSSEGRKLMTTTPSAA